MKMLQVFSPGYLNSQRKPLLLCHWLFFPMILAILFMGLSSTSTASANSASAVPAQNADQPSGTTLFLPLAIPSSTQQSTQVSAEAPGNGTPEIVRIFVDSQAQLNRIAAEIDIWEEATHENTRYVTASVYPAQKAMLLADGYRVEIDQELMDQYERTLSLFRHSLGHNHQLGAATQFTINEIPGFACYRTVEETHSDLADLAAANPNLASWIDIGDSWHKTTPGGPAGYDLQTLVLTNKSISGPKPKFTLIAAIHAREYTTAETATRYAEYLVDNYGLNADVTWLLDYYEIHILPQANPDGRKIAEGGELWRKNRNDTDGCNSSFQYGVDLNRNSSFKWGLSGGSSSDACSQTYRGSAPASEPEVQAIQDYARSLYPDSRGSLDTDAAPVDTSGLFISLHSYSELVLPAWGWTTSPAPNNDELFTLGRKFGYYTDYKVCAGASCLYAVSGTTDDWAYGELGVASYTFELGTTFFESCTTFEQTIYPDLLNSLIYAAKAARRPYLDPAGPEVVNLALSATTVPAGTPVTLSALVDDSRYASNGGGGTEAVQSIQGARYSIDLPSWAGGTTLPMSATDGFFNGTAENVNATIETSTFSEGQHILFVEGQDVDGNWGVASAIFLTVEQANGPLPTPTNTAPPSTMTPMPTNTPLATVTPTPTPTEPPVVDGCTLYSSSDVPQPMPNGTASVSASLTVADAINPTAVKVHVDMMHSWVGDLTMTLRHQETGQSVTLLDRPGLPGKSWGCSGDDLNATFDDQAALAAEAQCATSSPAISGDVRPSQSLSIFNGQLASGTWILTVDDSYLSADGGALEGWQLALCTGDGPPPPATNTPMPTATNTPVNTPLPTATPLPATPTAMPTTVSTGGNCTNYPSSNVPTELGVGTASAISTLTITDPVTVQDLAVNINLSHSWVGDVSLTLIHQESGISVPLVDRPGVPGGFWGCSQDNIVATLRDQAGLPVESQCNTNGPALSGTLKPEGLLSAFQGQSAAGTWLLQLTDAYPSADSGVLNQWSLDLCEP